MNKGIVMEQHRRFTIVMTTDGLIERAHPIKDADIGFEVIYEPLVQREWLTIFKDKFLTRRIVALACVFLIALLPFYMVTNSSETYAFVDIDINPSMELEIDSDLVVSDIIPFNDDAKLLLDQMSDLKGKNIEDAIEIIINTSEEKGLINTAKNVLIGVHYLNDEKKDPIIKTIEDHFDKKPTDWKVVTVVIPEEVRVKSEKKQQSMNKTLANSVTEQSDNQVKAIITEEDKEVLQSFFNKNNSEVETTNDNSPKRRVPAITNENENAGEKGKSFKDETHPSELKSKNSEINSNKNENGHYNRNGNGHHKEKHQEKFNNGNDRNKGKVNNESGKNIEKSKVKENHKGDRHKDKGKNGNGNNGKNDNRNNGKHHENKRNNEDGKGKNKDDGFSYSYPFYK